jgi:hypothetical protein
LINKFQTVFDVWQVNTATFYNIRTITAIVIAMIHQPPVDIEISIVSNTAKLHLGHPTVSGLFSA